MGSTFEATNLWKKQLAPTAAEDPFEKARAELRVAFLKARAAVEPLVAQIGKELPELTCHDMTHLDALWDVADTIMGQDYDVNPAETFVLGMSFLLHDSATSTYAFADGIDGLMKTVEWRDYVGQRQLAGSELESGKPAFKQALFETLRMLHPAQAEVLLTRQWQGLDGNPRYLMENVALRNHYGSIIGKIAASHGRNIELIESEWANAAPITPPMGLLSDAPIPWTVDCFKVALLLRCIDAAHIDSRRAPDMLAALVNPQGYSSEHWRFQNHLGRMWVDKNREIYWSATTFTEPEADCWWLFFDTAGMIDKEIRSSNRLLEDNKRSVLAVAGVAGAGDINSFTKFAPTQNWYPVDIRFAVSQVGGIIEKFGGVKLYGKEPYLALRELLQNASDAIHAHRILKRDPSYGKIYVSIAQENGEDWLHVLDNGVGMSRYVLTEVLLDFGRSLWQEGRLRQEWPGLAAENFKPMGQFGIGFFSVLMLGKRVKVTSWRYRASGVDQATLYLRDGVRSRPILVEAAAGDRLSDFGTKVSVCLEGGRENLLRKIRTESASFFNDEAEGRPIKLKELIGVLAPASDIDIYFDDMGEDTGLAVKADDWQGLPAMDLLKRLAPSYSDRDLGARAETMTDIYERDGRLVGRASLFGSGIAGFGFDMGILVHNGLVAGKTQLAGILLADNNSDLSRAAATPACSADAMIDFSSRFYSQLERKSTHTSELLLSAGYYSDDMPVGRLDGTNLSLSDIRLRIESEDVSEIIIYAGSVSCPDSISQDDFGSYFLPNDEVLFMSYSSNQRHNFGLPEWLSRILPDSEETPRTALGAVIKLIGNAWPEFSLAREVRVVGNVHGEEIEESCIVIFRDSSNGGMADDQDEEAEVTNSVD